MKTLLTFLAGGLLALVVLVSYGANAVMGVIDGPRGDGEYAVEEIALSGDASNPFHWEGNIAAGQTVEIKGVNGTIKARAAEGSQVEVRATKKGRRQAPESVKIDVVEHAGGVTICAVYPGRGNHCEPGKGGRLGAKNNDVEVEFEVRVPADVAFIGRTVNGSVRAAGLTGPATGRTVNGSVDLETEGHAEASTVNGSITAKLGRASLQGDLEFETVNGSISLWIPESINAEVRASSVNGRIKTDLPLEVPKTWHGGKARGTLGSGGARLDVSTVNGSINLNAG